MQDDSVRFAKTVAVGDKLVCVDRVARAVVRVRRVMTSDGIRTRIWLEGDTYPTEYSDEERVALAA